MDDPSSMTRSLSLSLSLYIYIYIEREREKLYIYILSGIRDSRKAGSLWGMRRGVGGVRKPIHRSWLTKRLGLGLLCWGFKGVQEEIPSEEASTLQKGSVAFPPGQCTSLQLHPCHRLFDQDGYQDSSSASHSPDLAPCDFWLFPKLRGCRYETIEMKEAVTRSLTRSHKRTSMGPSRSCWNGKKKCIAAGGDYFEGD